MAYYLSFHVAQRNALWLFVITIPFWTSYLLRVFAWKIILGYNGAINASLLELGIFAQPLDFVLYNANSVVITLDNAWVIGSASGRARVCKSVEIGGVGVT